MYLRYQSTRVSLSSSALDAIAPSAARSRRQSPHVTEIDSRPPLAASTPSASAWNVSLRRRVCGGRHNVRRRARAIAGARVGGCVRVLERGQAAPKAGREPGGTPLFPRRCPARQRT